MLRGLRRGGVVWWFDADVWRAGVLGSLLGTRGSAHPDVRQCMCVQHVPVAPLS